MGQSGVHDYVTITVWGQWTIAVSTDSALRAEVIEVEKGEENALVRGVASTNSRVLALVQEYETKGWELFTVYNDAQSSTWVMRKPKQ